MLLRCSILQTDRFDERKSTMKVWITMCAVVLGCCWTVNNAEAVEVRPIFCKKDADCQQKGNLPRPEHEEFYCGKMLSDGTGQCIPKSRIQKCSPGYAREQGGLGRCVHPTRLLRAYNHQLQRAILAESSARKWHEKYRWTAIKKNLYFYAALAFFIVLLAFGGRKR